MKRLLLAGLACFVGLAFATASMAHHGDIDVLVVDLKSDVGIYNLTMEPDDLMFVDVLADFDVVPDRLQGESIGTVQSFSLTEPMATRGGASGTMVDDAMRLWRSRTILSFTVSPDLLI